MTATDIVMPALSGHRILVAEADEDNSVALTALLRLEGFDAREARTGAAVVAAATKTQASLLIIDLDLPDTDGCDLIRRVRQLHNPPKVLVVTGHTAPGVRLAAVAAGADAYLLKPANSTELIELVRRLCTVERVAG